MTDGNGAAKLPPGPLLSVILPVLNETEGINATLEHLRGVMPDGSCEVIVVDGDPAGSTINIIADQGVTKHTAPRGRAAQMNEGARRASGDVLLFLHADTLLPESACGDIAAAMSCDTAGAGAFELGFPSERWYFRLIAFFANMRARLTSIPFGDQGIFIRRSLFEEIGGYSDIPLMEDIDMMRRIKKTRAGIVMLPGSVITSTRRWEKEGPLYTTLRNYALQLLYYLGVPPRRLVGLYYKDIPPDPQQALVLKPPAAVHKNADGSL